MYRYLILSFFLCCALNLYGSIQRSTLPRIQSLEELNGIDHKRYNQAQFAQIKTLLEQTQDKVRVVTFDISSNACDSRCDKELPWSERKALLEEMILHLDADVLGLQQVSQDQLEDLADLLEDRYRCLCRESSNVFFVDRERFQVLETRLWDQEVSVSLVKLLDRQTQRQVAFCNTHLVFADPEKRYQQALTAHRFVSEYLLEEHLTQPALVLMGNMNTFPNLPAVARLPFYDGDHVTAILKGDILDDSRECSLLGHLGPLKTVSHRKFGKAKLLFPDRIFVTKEISVLIHTANSAKVNGTFPSSHFPVLVDFIISKSS